MIGFYNYTVILTYIGTLAAIIGIMSAISGNAFRAIICLIIAGACDMFDGIVARTKKRTASEKNFGVWIDSLSDLLCFGVLPAVIGYSIGLNRAYYFFIIAVYILAALVRLGYYGVTEVERQSSSKSCDRVSFDGLPVTTAALIFPLLFCFRKILSPALFPPVYAFALACTALAFVLKIKVKKPNKHGITAILLFGIAIFVYLIVMN